METKRCKYCGKERPESELKPFKITFVGSKWNGYRWVKGVQQETNLYCADAPCGEHDQMAHEG